MSASSSTAPLPVWKVSVKPVALAADRFETVPALDLRLEAFGQFVNDPLVAAANLVALVAFAQQQRTPRCPSARRCRSGR